MAENKKQTIPSKAKNSEMASDEYPDDLEKEELLIESEDDSGEVPPSDIVAFNELRSCADLLRMKKAKQLEIQPDFQRDVVWNKPSQTRFIDSLIKQLPIPSMCISFDYKTNERMVIDGLQRMSSIINFLDNPSWKLSKLDDIDKKVSGRRVSYIKDKYPEIYDSVENLTIPITVLRCDHSNAKHMKYLFTIFHRLNTGGNKLSNQEIRNCIFNGEFNNLLKECVQDIDFRHVLGLKPNSSYRFAYEELVLRFFTFVDGFENYDGRFARYLNTYMQKVADIKDEDTLDSFLEKKRLLFKRTINLLYEKVLDGSSLPKFSKATIEAVLVGLGSNVDYLKQLEPEVLQQLLSKLRTSKEFHPSNLKNALTSKQKLIDRLNKAIAVFSGK